MSLEAKLLVTPLLSKLQRQAQAWFDVRTWLIVDEQLNLGSCELNDLSRFLDHPWLGAKHSIARTWQRSGSSFLVSL